MRIDNVSHYIVLDESLLEISIGVHMTLIPLGILTDTRKRAAVRPAVHPCLHDKWTRSRDQCFRFFRCKAIDDD